MNALCSVLACDANVWRIGDSLGEEELLPGLTALGDGEKRCGLVLIVDERVNIDLRNVLHLIKAENIFDVLVQRSSAYSVQIFANANFFKSNCIELLIVQAHVHSIVDVGPFRGVIDLVAVVSVSLHEVAGLDKVIENELLLHCSVISLCPPGAQGAQCLGRLNDLCRSHVFKSFSQHYLLFNIY